MIKKWLLFFLITLSFEVYVDAQENTSNSQLALQYFQNKEFEKASVLYQKLFETTQSKTYFTYYIKCLTELNNIELAEKEIKKQIKKDATDLSLYVELGNMYKTQNKTDEAIEQYEKAIKRLQSNQIQINTLANEFINKREFDFAEKVYLQARKILKNEYSYEFELANVYFYQRSYSKMINQYVAILLQNEAYVQEIQNRLQYTIYNDQDDNLRTLLKTTLLENVQKYPDKTILSELLIWLYIQEKEFSKALIQVKAIDKRNKETGDRVIAIGRLAKSNENYDVANTAFKYVMEKGKENPNYIIAQIEYLNSLYLKITKNPKHTQQEILELENNYETSINEFNKQDITQLIKDLAHIKAFYLNKTEEAIDLLESLIDFPKLKQSEIAEIKIELGDILLLSGDQWSATLYFAQAEKANENNPIGHEAKYRKARLAYYTNNFKWAQAQLDVLKASTSKLIANDAFALSQLIKDNTNDSADTELRFFARAELLEYQNNDSLALVTLDSITSLYPSHSLNDEVLFTKAKIMIKQKKFEAAAELYQKITTNYAYDILSDDALFALAELNEKVLNNPEKAKELYEEMLTKYPGSIFTIEARKRFRKLRGDKIDEDKPNFEEKPIYD